MIAGNLNRCNSGLEDARRALSIFVEDVGDVLARRLHEKAGSGDFGKCTCDVSWTEWKRPIKWWRIQRTLPAKPHGAHRLPQVSYE